MIKNKLKSLLSLLNAIIFFGIYFLDRHIGYPILGIIWLTVAFIYFNKRYDDVK